ncbi:unnamed protein product [Lota lota]
MPDWQLAIRGEESGEILSRDSNEVAGLLCPLCQQGLEDRSCLALHLTDQHNVLPTCVDKLLDIAVLKQCANPGDHESDTMKATDAASLPNLKSADNSGSQASQSEEAIDETRRSTEQAMAEARDNGDSPADASPPPCPKQSDLKGTQATDAAKRHSSTAARVDVAGAGEKPDRSAALLENAARSFKCNACLETFPTKTALSVHYNATSHIQRMTVGPAKQGVDSETQTTAAPVLSRPYISNKPYQCAVCRVSYNHAITLESHMKSVLHQTRSISAGNGSSAASSSGGVPSAAVVTTSAGPAPIIAAAAAATTNCQVSGLSGNLMMMAKDGEQIRVSQAAPSLLSSPVASPQAVSAFLTLLTSSTNALPHSLLPSVFTAASGLGPAGGAPPQMLMPLILNGSQTHQQADGQPGQILTQCVPLMGLSAAQQALVTQRLGSIQNQWSAVGIQAAAQLCQEAQQLSEKCEGGQVTRQSVEADQGPVGARVDVKKETEGEGVEFKQALKSDGKRSKSEKGDGLEENKPKLSLTASDLNLRNNSISPSASVLSNCSLSPGTLNLALSPDSTPQKSQRGTSPASSPCSPGTSPFRNPLMPSEQTRPYIDTRALCTRPVPPVLSEFQSEVLWAFFESRSEAEAASPPREDCEALGKEVGIPEAEVRRWLGQARHARERQRAERSDMERPAPRPASSDDEENALVIAEDGAADASEGQAMDLSSRGKKRRGRGPSREGQVDSCLTSDSENGEVYTSVIVSEEESRSTSKGPQQASPVKEYQAKRKASGAHQSSGGGKVLRSATVFLSDAEDEYDEEEGGGALGRRRRNAKKRKMEYECDDEVEVKRERPDSDVDLELEAQGDPPSAQHHTMDPMGLIHSLPMSLSLSPFSAQLLSPYVLSLPSALVGDAGKVQSFPNPPNISHFSDPLLAQTLSSLGQTPLYMANGDDGESALDLSMGKNGSSKSASASSSSSLMADIASAQKGRLLDGLGLRPTSKGLVVVQVKSESFGSMSAANSGSRLVNCNNGPKSSIYMRAAEKVNAALLDKEREKEQEKEKDQQLQRRSKGKRYRDMRRSRTIIQAEQLDILYGCYFKDPNPGKHEFEQISEWVHLPKKVVQIWFQNMRARERKGEVRFISDGTLAAVGKPLIKFTWPLSKPIFSNKTSSSNNTGCVTAAPIVRTLMTDKEAMKELGKLTWVKKQTPVPIKPKELVSSSSSTAAPVDSSVSTVSKVKLETTGNAAKAQVAPKVTAPTLPAPPKDPIPIAPRPLLTPKAEEESEEEKTDDEMESDNEVTPGAPNRMVPKLPATPMCVKPPATAPASQKPNGLNYWSPKGSFKINTLSREQLALPPPPPSTIPPPPTPSIAPVSPNSRCTAKMAIPPLPAKSSPADGGFLSHSSSRRPRTHLSCLQLSILQSCYETCAHPNAMECEAIGAELSLPLKVVQIWFQNTRAKEKRWKLQQEKMSPLTAGKVDTSSGSYLQYNALRANRPILPKPVQLTVIEPAASPVAGQPVPKESLTGRCEACSASFESRAAARTHVFSPRHLATLRTTNFGQPATLVNKNGTGASGSGGGSGSVPSSGRPSEGEMGGEALPPKASSNS